VGAESMKKASPNAIASRTLLLRLNGQEEIVQVEVGPFQNGSSCVSCHARIAGAESEIDQDIYGIDAIQALQLALKFIGSELNRVADEQCYFIQGFDEPGHGFESFLIDS
jgi:hypothetical protein